MAVVAANWGDVVGAVVWGLAALVDGGLPLAVRDVKSSSFVMTFRSFRTLIYVSDFSFTFRTLILRFGL